MTKELSALMNKVSEFILKNNHVYTNSRGQMKLDLMGWPARVESIEYALTATQMKMGDIHEFVMYCGKPNETNMMACMIRIVYNMFDVQLRNRIRTHMVVFDIEPKPRITDAEMEKIKFQSKVQDFRNKLPPDLWQEYDELIRSVRRFT